MIFNDRNNGSGGQVHTDSSQFWDSKPTGKMEKPHGRKLPCHMFDRPIVTTVQDDNFNIVAAPLFVQRGEAFVDRRQAVDAGNDDRDSHLLHIVQLRV